MSANEGSATMRRVDSGLLTRSVLVALAALLAVGIALHGDTAKGRAQSDPLVNALGEEELGKFAVVDMVDALDRVAGGSGAVQAD
jgi:hypothetical protein